MASTTTTRPPSSSPPQEPSSIPKAPLRYADIGINLTDPIYRGGRSYPDDLDHVIQRSRSAGVQKMMVTGSDLSESKAAIELAREYPGVCYATVGVHPCAAQTFQKHDGGDAQLIEELTAVAREGRDQKLVVAFGEIGLDYDRLHFADKETQIKYFSWQLDVAVQLQMPLFLHSRAAAEDFEAILRPRLEQLPRRGVVHSFTGTLEEMQRIVDMGFDVGVNGCSMKTEESLAVVNEIPLERLQIETDGPWCEMRQSHASSKFTKNAPALPNAVKKEKWKSGWMAKGRNEPCTISHVAWAIAGIKGVAVEEIAEAAWRNSIRMFGLGESSPS